MTTQKNIVYGPSKFDLMVSLFEGNPTLRKRVSFSVDTGFTTSAPPGKKLGMTEKIEIAITGVSQEDGGGESWLFEGYSNEHKKVYGYYSSQTRKGWINTRPK